MPGFMQSESRLSVSTTKEHESGHFDSLEGKMQNLEQIIELLKNMNFLYFDNPEEDCFIEISPSDGVAKFFIKDLDSNKTIGKFTLSKEILELIINLI
jgi:hypothetical protein